ncbi:MAG: potassium-transporting ATPase subunit KdpA [Bacteroidetes bacterium]|nr:potassium-transporting ATPase subunit KdpA [Bacteroidota bacterium]
MWFGGFCFWATNTTATSNGSVNSMHDSMTPLTGLTTLLGMMINCFLWWGRRWVFKLLHFYNSCSIYQWFNGWQNT